MECEIYKYIAECRMPYAGWIKQVKWGMWKVKCEMYLIDLQDCQIARFAGFKRLKN